MENDTQFEIDFIHSIRWLYLIAQVEMFQAHHSYGQCNSTRDQRDLDSQCMLYKYKDDWDRL